MPLNLKSESRKGVRDYNVLLRDWYLANMRRHAHELASEEVTPSERISADKALLEKLSLGENQQTKEPRNSSTGNAVVAITTDVILACGPVAVIAIYAFAGTADFAARSIIALMVGAFVAWLQACLRNKTRLLELELQVKEIVEVDGEVPSIKVVDRLQPMLAERKEMQQSLNLLASCSSYSLFCLNKDLCVLACNATSARELQTKPELLEGKNLLDFIHPDERERFSERFKLAYSPSASEPFEAQMILSTARVMEMRWSVEFSNSGNCFFVRAENISAEKTLQRVKQEFVAMIGHDIKTPLGAVIMNTTALEEGVYGPISEAAALCVRGIRKSLLRMVALLNELLEYEKTVAGKTVLQKESVRLRELIEDSVTELSAELEHRRIVVKLELTDGSASVDVDKILRVLLNLISNAIKYSPVESVLTIEMVESQNSIEVRITDMGPGIAREYQASIFERFNRIQNESNKTVQGTGLGLPIAKAIVEAHGGLIGIESTPGKGSTFWFALPGHRDNR